MSDAVRSGSSCSSNGEEGTDSRSIGERRERILYKLVLTGGGLK